MTLRIDLRREDGDGFSTLGKLSVPGIAPIIYTLERAKVFAEHPRIPAGIYALELKPLGTSHFDARMTALMESIGQEHHGMVRLKNVPGRTDILIHIANYWHELLGCIAVGLGHQHGIDQSTDPPYAPNPSTYWIQNSTAAYKLVYPVLRDAIELHGGAEIHVADEPTEVPLA